MLELYFLFISSLFFVVVAITITKLFMESTIFTSASLNISLDFTSGTSDNLEKMKQTISPQEQVT